MMPPAWFPAAIVAVVGIAFALLTRRVARRIGRSPNWFGRSDTAHDSLGRVYRVADGVLFTFPVLRCLRPGSDMAACQIPVHAVPQRSP